MNSEVEQAAGRVSAFLIRWSQLDGADRDKVFELDGGETVLSTQDLRTLLALLPPPRERRQSRPWFNIETVEVGKEGVPHWQVHWRVWNSNHTTEGTLGFEAAPEELLAKLWAAFEDGVHDRLAHDFR